MGCVFVRFCCWFLVPVTVFALGGCGGGGGSSHDSGQAISGQLTDGPIAGAWIELHDTATGDLLQACGASGAGVCRTLTDDNGYFDFQASSLVDLSSCSLVSSGGLDAVTGVDYSPFHLRLDLALMAGNASDVTISPVTTLTSQYLLGGDNLVQALGRAVQIIGLAAGSDPLADPAASPELQRGSLILVKLIRELDRAGVEDPFSLLATQVNAPLLAQGEFPSSRLGGLGLDDAALTRIDDLAGRLDGGADDPILFAEEELFQAFGEIVALLFAETADLNDGAFQSNGRELAHQLRVAAGGEPVPLNRIAPQRLARYAIHAYGFDSFAELSAPAEEFAAQLAGDASLQLPPLASNPKVPELASLTSLYAVEVPLLPSQLLGTSNAARVSYFYQSDASPFYAAETLVGEVADDQLNDQILVSVVKGKAEAGLIDEAIALVETQIYQSAAKGDGYLEIARVLIGLGRLAEAIENLDLAFDFYQRVVAAKGAGQLGSRDSQTLYAIANNYRQAGDLAAEAGVIAYLEAIAQESGDATIYGRVAVANRDLADDLIAAGDFETAREYLDAMLALARQTPPNESTRSGVTYRYYKLRVFSLEEAARRYAEIGDATTVWEIYQEIKALCEDDGLEQLTDNETWYYLALIVDDLYRSGFEEEALAVAGSIPAEYENYYGAIRSNEFNQQTAYQSVVEWVALNQGVAAALPLLEPYFPDIPDRIEAMTYFAQNRSNGNLAGVLIDAGRNADADIVLDAAGVLLGGYLPDADQDRLDDLVEDGYLKLARLYLEIGSLPKATNQLTLALAVIDGMSGLRYRVEGWALAAAVSDLLGDAVTAESLLNSGWAGMMAVGSEIDPADAAELLQLIAEGSRSLGMSPPAALLADWEAAIAGMFDPVASYSGNAHDVAARAQIRQYDAAATLLAGLGDLAGATQLLDAAEATAWEILVVSSRMDQLIGIAATWAEIGLTEEALRLADELPFLASRSEAFQAIAEALVARDDFPDSPVASIDTDGDGRPDFWNPLATAAEILASGFSLDSDSDGDGLPDASDPRPLFSDGPN